MTTDDNRQQQMTTDNNRQQQTTTDNNRQQMTTDDNKMMTRSLEIEFLYIVALALKS